jgi:hypothetical protein
LRYLSHLHSIGISHIAFSIELAFSLFRRVLLLFRPIPTTITRMATAVYSMPARGNRTAPQFDPSQPRELWRYFGDLDFHFTRSQITADQERKGHCCRYVDLDTSKLWESLTEFSDITKTYSNFRQVIYKLYPGSGEERRWLVADVEKPVEERSRIGVHSLGDLGDYYWHFISITTFLRSKS